jgi:hypothetical protein
MPTIDELDAALAVADTDELMLSQSGTARKATRAQVVAGLQLQIALGTGQLLGRVSPGTGIPEPISVGANLSIASGTLAAYPPPLLINSLPGGVTPSPPDLVPAAQGGQSVVVPYASFMAGLPGIPGIDGSNLTVLPSPATSARRLADILSNVVTVEAFGAKGDGQTDDTGAFAAAVATGLPVCLGPRAYVVNGQWTISTSNAFLFGTPGRTVLRRHSQTGDGAWIAIQAAGFRADGIIFDANRSSVTQDSWSVLVTSICINSDFQRCGFINSGGATLGCGLVFQASDPAIVEHVIRDCEFANNNVHGLWVQACAGVLVEGCRAHDNGQYGICLDYNDTTFRQKIRLGQVLGCRAWNNTRGIAVGNFNETNGQPPTWGNANPDAISIVVSGNVCHDNSLYGIAASGRALAVQGNMLVDNGAVGGPGAGILANVSYTRVASNVITGGAIYGIDCGGSIMGDIVANDVDGPLIGINCGGSTSVRVAGNTLRDFSDWAIVANNVEADANGLNFGIACSLLSITGNVIGMNGAGAHGIALRDGPLDVVVANNSFNGTNGAILGNCLWANTDSIIVHSNVWNGTPRLIANPIALGGLSTIVFPDIADTVIVTAVTGPVQSMMSAYQVLVVGQITFIRVTAGGQGYTEASVTIGGVGGGAQASAIVSGGTVIGIAVSEPGSGYGPFGTMVPITITGDGTGAEATGFAGLPLADERQVRVRCSSAVVFSRSGSSPTQENWTLNDLTVPANGDVDWVATYGMWRAMRATPSLLAGCLGATGHGSPEGVITATPGSDYRNLDGGVGATLWVKQTGDGNTGWFAVA